LATVTNIASKTSFDFVIILQIVVPQKKVSFDFGQGIIVNKHIRDINELPTFFASERQRFVTHLKFMAAM
jgi:hypothetical protein